VTFTFTFTHMYIYVFQMSFNRTFIDRSSYVVPLDSLSLS
jgi:hypothetical protein